MRPNEQTCAQNACGAARFLLAAAMENSSRIAAFFDEDSGSLKVSWKRAAMEASGVIGDVLDVLADAGFHFRSMTRLA
jgi:hypothetical protein